MSDREKLYDAFGELIFAVAIADGHIQDEETAKLKEMTQNHPWAKEILWSFNYEAQKSKDPQDTYKKALMTLQDHGPDKEYAFLLELLEEVAKASDGIDQDEAKVIDGMKQSLKDHFVSHLKENDLIV